jgi:redox-sensitive bicupin YhaK (pirin superfamily)
MDAILEAPAAALGRRIVGRTRGRRHGGITRLVSPSDVGQLIKPFVFLDSLEIEPTGAPMFGWHPHSGIATITFLLEGTATYEETTGAKGLLPSGGVEWMRAGGGVWHTGGIAPGGVVKGFQLWIALPPDLENGKSESCHLLAEQVPQAGPARVVLGSYGNARSPVPVPAGINYLAVDLKAGERWTYQPPQGHTVGWIAVHQGTLHTPEPVLAGELAVFDEGTGAIEFNARDDTRFVLGSAVKHPHELVVGSYSVHSSNAALAKGEAEIDRIGLQLREQGVLRR